MYICSGTTEVRWGYADKAVLATHLPWAPNLNTALLEHHLTPVRQPADHARDDEENREEIQRKTCQYRHTTQRSD